MLCSMTISAGRDFTSPLLQGRVRTKTVKKSARLVVERFYQKLSQNDFDTNKRVSNCELSEH